jgi:hypothetical protein
MPSLGEIWRALHGAWRFLFLDTGGLAEFDGTRSGGLRSFWAIALVVPLNLAITAIYELGPTSDALPLRNAAFVLVGSIVVWPLMLLVIYGLARWYGRAERYWLFVTTYNWTQIPLNLVAVVMIALFTGAESLVDLNDPEGSSAGAALVAAAAFLVAWALRLVIYAYEWYVAWISLDAGIALPIIVVLLDLASGPALDKLANALT